MNDRLLYTKIISEKGKYGAIKRYVLKNLISFDEENNISNLAVILYNICISFHSFIHLRKLIKWITNYAKLNYSAVNFMLSIYPYFKEQSFYYMKSQDREHVKNVIKQLFWKMMKQNSFKVNEICDLMKVNLQIVESKYVIGIVQIPMKYMLDYYDYDYKTLKLYFYEQVNKNNMHDLYTFLNTVSEKKKTQPNKKIIKYLENWFKYINSVPIYGETYLYCDVQYLVRRIKEITNKTIVKELMNTLQSIMQNQISLPNDMFEESYMKYVQLLYCNLNYVYYLYSNGLLKMTSNKQKYIIESKNKDKYIQYIVIN
jgi:hypothetical protein